jgi:hypothetical protein
MAAIVPTPFTMSELFDGVCVTGGLGALKVLERAYQVEKPHRDDDRHESQHVRGAGRLWQAFMNGWGTQRDVERARKGRAVHAPEAPGKRGADYNGYKPGREALGEFEAAYVLEQNQAHRREPDEGVLEYAEAEVHRDERDGDAGESGEQRRPRCYPLYPPGYICPAELNQPGAQACGKPDTPCKLRVVRLAHNREHHEQDEGEEGYGVYPKRERGGHPLAGAANQRPRLEGVIDVAHKQADRDAGQYPAIYERAGHAKKPGAERDYQDKLDEVVHEQPEEAVEVTLVPPFKRMRHVKFVTFLARKVTPKKLMTK